MRRGTTSGHGQHEIDRRDVLEPGCESLDRSLSLVERRDEIGHDDEARFGDGALQQPPDRAAAVAEEQRDVAAGLQHPAALAQCLRQDAFVSVRRPIAACVNPVHDRLKTCFGQASAWQPSLLEQIHIRVEDVRTEGRIGEDVID